MFTKTLATATASALLAGGAVAYTSTAATPAKPPEPPVTMGAKLAQRQDRVAARQAELAQRLGVTADQLESANGALLKRNLDVRVAAGRLTVAERSAILACRAAPLTCDRTNLPARKAAKRKRKDVAKRQAKRAAALAGQLSLDQQKVLAALKAQRKAHHKG